MAHRAARGQDIVNAVKSVSPHTVVIFHHTCKDPVYANCYRTSGGSIGCERSPWMPTGTGDYEAPENYTLPDLEVVDQMVSELDLAGTIPVLNPYGWNNEHKLTEPFSPDIMRAAGREVPQRGRGRGHRPSQIGNLTAVDWDYWIGQTSALIEGLTEDL